VYRLPAEVKLKGNELFEEGVVAGLDYSSACVVQLVGVKEGERVLDLCCAPGAKLAFLCDQGARATGVDISHNRLNTCRSLLKKYGLEAELVEADGCTYSPEEKFEVVLVDAECTHEGSAKHLAKFREGRGGPVRKISKQQARQFRLNNLNPYVAPVNHKNSWGEQDFE
jgi:16S rRNA C967 or C1407 C5-methylase (RsmB/RsmF family)